MISETHTAYGSGEPRQGRMRLLARYQFSSRVDRRDILKLWEAGFAKRRAEVNSAQFRKGDQPDVNILFALAAKHDHICCMRRRTRHFSRGKNSRSGSFVEKQKPEARIFANGISRRGSGGTQSIIAVKKSWIKQAPLLEERIRLQSKPFDVFTGRCI